VADLTNCDTEPIHIPGAIQPHGVLFVLDEPALNVVQVSENVGEHLQLAVDAVLGRPLSSMIDPASAEEVREVLLQERWYDANPLRCAARGKRFDGIVHRYQGVAILEIEPTLDPPSPPSAHHPFRSVLLRMQRVNTLAELGEIVVESMRQVTGFERAMFYRFHEDGHGSVDVEAKAPALETYLGLHYPASDIPAQARRLYLENWLRLIVDGRATPARIVPALAKPLDLSFAVLRSVSPIHLEYMANMGVRASMSISLVVRGRLWGLISCLNHSGPRRVSHETREACEFLGRLASLQIAALADRELLALRAARRTTEDALTAVMRESAPDRSVLGGLLAHPNELMGLVEAGGAAVMGPEELATCGRTPPPRLIQEIAAWVQHEQSELRPFATDSLGALFPRALPASDVASGLLTFSLPGVPQRRLLWFRPEVIETVSWGGDPRKSVATDSGGHLRPRHSFARWRDEVRYRSRPWSPSDLEAADELQRRAFEVDLERRLASEQRAVHARDEVVAVVSHDLRGPLSTILMQAEVISKMTLDNRVVPPANVERMKKSASHMKAMVENLLDLAKIEAQNFVVHPERVHSRSIVEEALSAVVPLAEAKRVSVSAEWVDAPSVDVEPQQILRVLSNLLGNALKFTPEGGTITVRTERRGDELMITVADTGPGIPADQLPWLFERYWQARPARDVGAGLGLYIAKGIVVAHGGRIWAEFSPNGARLCFTLPVSRATPHAARRRSDDGS